MSDDAIGRLEAAALKAREFQHKLGAREYTLRIPTRTEVRETVHDCGLGRSSLDAMTLPLLRHYLLLQGVVGWTGVRESDVVPDAGSAPLPWSPRAVALLLDAQPNDAEALGKALLDAADRRDQGIAAAAKNSSPASTEPGTTQAQPTSA